MILLLLATTALGYALYLALEALTSKARAQEVSLQRARRYGIAQMQPRQAPRVPFQTRVVVPAVDRLARLAVRVTPRAAVQSYGARLLASGLASRFTTMQFLALKSALALAGLVTLTLLALAASPAAAAVLAPAGCLLGFLGPDAYLTMRVRTRRELIRAQLPDALDVLAVSVEAGLGLDGAIVKLTEHMHGPLVDEFALALGEIRIGASRHAALRKMGERVPTQEIAAFVRAVIQSDQLGISLGRILRVQAADSRLRRQATAEEKAMKTPIKMLFPTAFFIFPAMFLVILGPALLNMNVIFK